MESNFIHFLQVSITPVALISGVGLLLLTITNRLGRTIDRTRILLADLDCPGKEKLSWKVEEVKILALRSKYLRASIALMALSVLCSSIIIPLLAISMVIEANLLWFGYTLFSISIFSIIISMILFFIDIVLSLKAVSIETDPVVTEK